MELNRKQKDFLSAVRLFEKTGRYNGMMPRWVVDSYNEQDVRDAFVSGCVAYSAFSHLGTSAMEGLILTDKGIALLREH